MIRVDVKPELLDWAIERSCGREEILSERFPKIEEWRSGKSRPTLRQLEKFANLARVPVGYLYLTEPPDEPLPITDMRTLGSQGIRRPSPDLLDTIYLCQQRQAWYHDYAERTGERTRNYVGSASTEDEPAAVAEAIRNTLTFTLDDQKACKNWEVALRLFIAKAEEAGLLVMISGVVASNTSRPLNIDEFRGFALSDKLAPLVFVNGVDSKAAQMFTLAHELSHIWLGESALSDLSQKSLAIATEKWCNQVAAELLVPLKSLRNELGREDAIDSVDHLAGVFKVSTLVILRRLRDAGRITENEFRRAYAIRLSRFKSRLKSEGGDFYRTQLSRVGRRFARALVGSALEGQTLFRDAFRMLGVKNDKILRKLGQQAAV